MLFSQKTQYSSDIFTYLYSQNRRNICPFKLPVICEHGIQCCQIFLIFLIPAYIFEILDLFKTVVAKSLIFH